MTSNDESAALPLPSCAAHALATLRLRIGDLESAITQLEAVLKRRRRRVRRKMSHI